MTSYLFPWPRAPLFVLGLCLIHSALAAEPSTVPASPLQANIVGALDVTRLKEGSPVLALVQAEWTSGDCHLLPNTLVHGHVSQVVRRSKTEKISSFQVVLEKAECNKGLPTDFPLTQPPDCTANRRCRHAFGSPAPQADDITVLTLQRLPA